MVELPIARTDTRINYGLSLMAEAAQHYTVLARRFRPQTFDEVIGQENVAQALKNAIRGDRVAHAYLFTGARGVGKTSMARILAKALNCPNSTDGIPCNACEICESISAGSDVDVLEIDGASNRGIDDIRSLRANVSVRSMRTQFKLYIIDEVHMLTREAFNALLKTLEEPPPNVKFVFCTTEPNKVPDTILSRCQRFDFASIATQSIMTRLRQIADAEGYAVEPAALELVARRAGGSMRDSQSLFDQVLAFGDENISADDVHRLLGTAGDDRLIDFFDAIIARDRAATLGMLDAAMRDGVQLGELLDQLLDYTRDLMVLASGAESVALASVAQETRDKLSEQAKQWKLETVVAAMQILADTKTRIFRASYGRALAELALVRLTMLQDLSRVAEIIAGIPQGVASAPAEQPKTAQSPIKAAAAASASEPDTTEPSPAKPAQKKSDEAENSADAEQSSSPVVPVRCDLKPGREGEFLTHLVSEFRDMTGDHARAASSAAISGPNQLALFFPASYDFSKRYCERPEVLSRLQAVASRIADRPIQISLKTNEKQPEKRPAPTAQRKNAGPLQIPKDDEFLQHAIELFGATVVRVEKRRDKVVAEAE